MQTLHPIASSATLYGSSRQKSEYTVGVRPCGPVPIQVLEWRIREDVPTNLRVVKAVSIDLGEEGVLAL